MSVYVSGYTDAGGQGIYMYDFDDHGRLTNGRLAAEAQQASYFVIGATGETLYTVVEVTEYNGVNDSGAVQAFRRNTKDGSLVALNTVASAGGAPCHAVEDSSGKYIHIANYMGGSVSSFAIEADGRIGAMASLNKHSGDRATGGVPDRQEAPHAHSIDLVQPGWALCCDLGTDLLVVYKRTGAAGLERTGEFRFPDGAGPRHVAVAHDRVYVLTELSVEVYVLEFNSETGQLTEIEHLAARPAGNAEFATGAEIALTPDNRFLYASLREIDQVAMYTVHAASGTLSLIGHVSCSGVHPRQFAIDPSGRYLVLGNMISNSIAVFSIDPTTGHLSRVHTVRHPQPTCIQFCN